MPLWLLLLLVVAGPPPVIMILDGGGVGGAYRGRALSRGPSRVSQGHQAMSAFEEMRAL